MLEWAGATLIFCEIDQNPDLTGIGICFVCYQHIYSDICHQHFMPHRAINYIIERFGYFLVFHSINYHSIYYRTLHKVTKTLNKVIIARWNILKCQWHMSKYTHNKAHSFIKCQQAIRMIISKPLACTTLNFADSSQNKYQFLSCLDFGQFYKCGSCSLKYTISPNVLVSLFW